jgi:hypothetical protein
MKNRSKETNSKNSKAQINKIVNEVFTELLDVETLNGIFKDLSYSCESSNKPKSELLSNFETKVYCLSGVIADKLKSVINITDNLEVVTRVNAMIDVRLKEMKNK